MDTSMYTPVDFDPVTPPLTSRPSKRRCTLAHFAHDGPLSPSDVRLLDVPITCSYDESSLPSIHPRLLDVPITYSYDQSSLPFVHPHVSVLGTNSAALGHLDAPGGSCYVNVPVLQSTELSFGCSSQPGPKCLCLPEPSSQTTCSLLVESPSPPLAPCLLSQCRTLDDSSLYDVTVTETFDSAVFASTRGYQIGRSVFVDGFSVSLPRPDVVVGVAVGTILPSMSGTPPLIGCDSSLVNVPVAAAYANNCSPSDVLTLLCLISLLSPFHSCIYALYLVFFFDPSLCCQQGIVSLQVRHPAPQFLDSLLDPHGGKIDNSVNLGPGPYIFRLNNQTYHQIGPLLPSDGQQPQFAQLYIYDCANEATNRVSAVTGRITADEINQSIVEGLIAMFDSCNAVVKLFRTTKERIDADGSKAVRIRLIRSRGSDLRTYSLPTSTQIGGLIVGDYGRAQGDRDVIVHHKNHRLEHISTVHPLYMSLQYPILFPYGEDGFTPHIKYVDSPVKQRTGEILLRGGRLFQQYCVDAYSSVQEGELLWLNNHQTEIFADMYTNVRDAVHRGDVDTSAIGKRVILPASFTGGPRYLYQKYQDAMTIFRAYGYPDLFITFTCNGNWPEMKDALSFYPGLHPEDHPDLVARVFHIKLRHFLHDIFKRGHFGPALAVTYTVEFQKRGLPHAHILLWLQQSLKFKSPSDIDRFVSAEIPDKDLDPIGYEAVTSLMMHDPCGPSKPRAACMEGGRCDKFFPKKFVANTKIDDQGYPTYRRRDTGASCVKGGIVMDNRFVVPHNVDLLVRYQAHINVEACNKSRAIKYFFKYINKGPNRSRAVIETNRSSGDVQTSEHGHVFNEIEAYLDCRYVCAYEACWRLFSFDIHFRQPAVFRLLVHLRGRHNVYFQAQSSVGSILSRPNVEKTMFTEWMVANSVYADARQLLYADFPSKFVWHADLKKWEPRRRGKCIGRVVQINALAGELYYLRLLLNVVRGPRNYDEIRTVRGVLYPTFQAACKAYGLTGNDRQWHDAMFEAGHAALPYELRELFVMIIVFSQVATPLTLFEQHWKMMAEDIEHRFKKQPCRKNLPLPRANSASYREDKLLLKEMSYARDEIERDRQFHVNSLNPQQALIYNAIMASVVASDPKVFFVHGHGGTGKMFLWKAVLAEVRLAGHVALAVASSGIASLLLPGGRTAHSRFKIPICIDQWSTCDIFKGTQLARLIQSTKIIVWDKEPMMHRHYIEAVDRSLRDVCGSVKTELRNKSFGGITVIFGGDLRQILPVIPGASQTDVVAFSICHSPLWQGCRVLHMTVNMRLLRSDVDPHSRRDLEDFASWLILIGDGTIPPVRPSDDTPGDWIQIPDDLLIPLHGDPIQAIIQEIFPDFVNYYADCSYLGQHAIITPVNLMVDRINAAVLELIPGPVMEYYSSD
ncbi:DNA helicase PIF1, ATP-dependent [Corchorus olitorius]|uniref:ATP-dependent DNA helicase n=1 Tax=Corchorus olitorius TaxID=93759 RepID=A0A1R3G8Y7_9ROSI|nr:DNA helicase PIF1, ATP-dependent [Corchorus olitorius]